MVQTFWRYRRKQNFYIMKCEVIWSYYRQQNLTLNSKQTEIIISIQLLSLRVNSLTAPHWPHWLVQLIFNGYFIINFVLSEVKPIEEFWCLEAPVSEWLENFRAQRYLPQHFIKGILPYFNISHSTHDWHRCWEEGRKSIRKLNSTLRNSFLVPEN